MHKTATNDGKRIVKRVRMVRKSSEKFIKRTFNHKKAVLK